MMRYVMEHDDMIARMTVVMLMTADIVNRVILADWEEASDLEDLVVQVEVLIAEMDVRVAQIESGAD